MYQFGFFRIPERMMEGIELYVQHHIRPGDFLCAVICNDLKEAVARADDENMMNLPAFVDYFYNNAPPACWGSKKKLDEWLALRKVPE